MKTKTKKLVTLAMLCAVAYTLMLVGRVPVVLFLKYDPKDVVIVLGGFLFGPMASFIISVVVSFIEMFTASDTWIIGCIMNVLSSCSFACTAAWIYKKKHTLKGAVAGLAAGVVLATAAMLLWNYLITPIWMMIPREEVVKLLVPVFLPFNLLKNGLNMAFVLLVYKPVVSALRRAGLAELSSAPASGNRRIGVTLVSALAAATLILLLLAMKGVL